MKPRKLNNIIESYKFFTEEAAKEIRFVFIKKDDLESHSVECPVLTLHELRMRLEPTIDAATILADSNKAIFFEKAVNRYLSIIYISQEEDI